MQTELIIVMVNFSDFSYTLFEKNDHLVILFISLQYAGY